MNQAKVWLSGVGTVAFSFVVPILAYAQSGPGPAKNTGGSPTPAAGITSAQGVLNYVCIIYGWLFYFLIAFVVVFVVIAAYGYLTSAGNSEKVKVAQSRLLYAAIAVAVALLAWGIPQIVGSFLNSSGQSSLAAC